MFSPSGNQVLYWVEGGGLYLINTDGSNNHVVWQAWWNEYDWAPDGSRIALAIPGRGIHFVNPDGTQREPITDRFGYDIRGPIYSPDGSHILFWAYGGQGKRHPGIGFCYYSVPIDGSKLPKLIGSGWDARWSPDGKMIFLRGWPLYLEQYEPHSYYEADFYAVMADASGYWQLPESQIGLVTGEWQPGSFAVHNPDFVPIKEYHFSSSQSTNDISPLTENFLGVWVNQDPNTQGTTRLEIRQSGEILLIRMWGSCSPEDCYIGEVVANINDLENNLITFMNDKGWSITRGEVLLGAPDSLTAKIRRTFTDNSDRPSYSRVEKFIRVKGTPSPEPISSCLPVLGDYDPLQFPYPASFTDVQENFEANEPPAITPHLPFSQPPLFDDFNGKNINTGLWEIPEDFSNHFQLHQKDGVLNIKGSSDGPQPVHNYLNLKNMEITSEVEKIVYEARVRVNNISGAAGRIGISMISPLRVGEGWWGIHCSLMVGESSGQKDQLFICQSYPEYLFQFTPIEFDTWYLLRFEFDREVGSFQIYLDNELMDSFIPEEFRTLKNQSFYAKINIGAGYRQGVYANFSADIDEVSITR